MEQGHINKKKIIVGLDPGTTCGVGILDLNMNPLFFTSIRGANRDTIVKCISKMGEPVLVACDVSQTPDIVRKVASLFNASLFTPKRDLSPNEKRKILAQYLPSLPKGLDAHMLDALASALKAYLGYKSKFEKIEARLQRLLNPKTIDHIRSEIIKGVRLTHIISREINRLEEESKERVVKIYIQNSKKKEHQQSRKPDIQTMNLLQWEVSQLKNELKKITEERDRLETALRRRLSQDYKKMKKEQFYQIQEKEIHDLKQRLANAEWKIREVTSQSIEAPSKKILEKFVPLQIIPTFTYDEVEKASKKIIDGTFIFLTNAAGGGISTAKKLAETKPHAIIRGTEMSHQAEEIFSKNGIPVIPSQDLEIQYSNKIPIIEKTALKKKIREYKRKQVNSVISEMIKSINEKKCYLFFS